MDSRLKALIGDEEQTANWIRAGGVREGVEFAVQRLRENEYYGHYAQFLATWLEKHLIQEVKSDKATDK